MYVFLSSLLGVAWLNDLVCITRSLTLMLRVSLAQREGHTAESLARVSGFTDIEDFLREQAESVCDAVFSFRSFSSAKFMPD